ncbi:RNA-guided endonuclease InsQ/TnpB family protein [Gloeobacter kilaueensis]|uniref:Transposase, IS605 OrfB family n=1 Tax=Gloeobacter kilaueensis (strain ATCC BAA-2537 / CCAP 1431/1 / ULC 316 / JS1) TaxID=1183438 RepID=U5QEX9_GLOK1|nr:RNA-guided endonuclease TnpB family protein [Gloeobacter kilaueensis]AGY57408.1 transposase, IS605 OrfB family [Gloeobacter kilaueensis JS1]
MIKTFQYRLYPTKSQAKSLVATLETCRRFYNLCLEERKMAYQLQGQTITKVQQLRRVKQYRKSHAFAAKVHSHVLQVVVADIDKAFGAFFRRAKAGETPGYPRFKGRNRFRSFGLKELGNGFKLDGRRLKLFGVGRLAVRWHRPLVGTIKTLRIAYKAGQWFGSFACEVQTAQVAATGKEVGVDLGINSLIATSDGQHEENPRWYRSEQSKLRVLQRSVARKLKGGTGRKKAVLALQKQHARIVGRRKDFLDKLAYRLISRYDRIALEDLRITNMVRNRHLSKSILDAGWGYFTQRLAHSAASANRVVSLVSPAYTSKTCSCCGAVFEHLTLAQRWVECSCGLSMDRDENAARNILRLGQSLWASSSTMVGFAQEAVAL